MVIEGGGAIGDFLVAGGDEALLYLPGVGWLTTRRYQVYQGPGAGTGAPAPSKRLPFLSADPALTGALNGLPPSGRTFADERARYLDAIHPLGYCPEGDVIADACVYLLSDKARFVTGHIMHVSGGAELGYNRPL